MLSLKDLTNLSAAPLLAGWYGAVVKCSILYDDKYFFNSADVNGGPLSVTIKSQYPYVLKISSKQSISEAALVLDFIFLTIANFDFASTTTSHLNPRNGPAKSACNLDQTHSGSGQLENTLEGQLANSEHFGIF